MKNMKHYNNFLSQIKYNIGSIVLFGILVAALSFLFLVTNEKNFRVSTDYLVVQNSQNTTDTYALAKSAEYAGKILSEGMRSELFINEVIKTGKVNQEFLPFDKSSKLSEWKKKATVTQNANLGIISVSVFDDNQRQAIGISEAISDVMTTKNSLFRGEGQNIEVRILSGPVVEKNPSTSKIIAAIIAGFLFGAMIYIAWVFYKTGDELEKYRSQIAFKEMGYENMSNEKFNTEENSHNESLKAPDRY